MPGFHCVMVSIHVLDVFCDLTLKRKEEDTGLWVALAHLGLCCRHGQPASRSVHPWPRDKESQRPQGHCSQVPRAVRVKEASEKARL